MVSSSGNTVPLTMERIDPLLIDTDCEFDRLTLELHRERYQFASRFAVGKSVVDCACGTGYGAAMLAQAGAASVVGVDCSVDAVEFANAHYRNASVDFVVADALAFRPVQAVDLWVSLETIEHLDKPAEYLRHVARHMLAGGMLVASVPTTVSTDGNPYHKHDFSRSSFRRMVRQAGFVIRDEAVQRQRFKLSDAIGKSRGPRQKSDRGLLGFYWRHPKVAVSRVVQTLTKGLVNEYLTVSAERS